MGLIKVPLLVKLPFSTLQKFGRLVLWEAIFILELHFAETQGIEKEGIMILEKILKLAEKNSISVSCLEKTLGFGNGTIKKWRESYPSVDKLKKVADHFGVGIEYFLE